MDKRLRKFTTLCFMLAALFFLAVVTGASADSIQNQIDALKAEVAKLEGQQLELKKQATEAAAALPTFSYRPGSGVTIEAPDKSWSLRAAFESHFRMEFLHGRDDAGRSQGEVMGRRFRPFFYYCINNCLYEFEWGLDNDGWGTGNRAPSMLQRGTLWVHLENINPWLPTFYTGMEIPTGMSSIRQGSSAIGTQAEYDILSRNNGFNTGRSGQGIGLNWDNKPLSAIGIPGRLVRLNLAMAAVGEGDDGNQSRTDSKDFVAFIALQPFSQIKNKWIQGMQFEFGSWFCNNDPNAAENGCSGMNLRDHGDGGRQTLFRTRIRIRERERIRLAATGNPTFSQTDVTTSIDAPRGMHHFLMPGFQWTIGPYRLRATGGFQRYQANEQGFEGAVNTPGTTTPVFNAINIGKRRVKANNINIGHDLFLWSPKGFLTGSATTPGSVLVGFHWERTDASCTIPTITAESGGVTVLTPTAPGCSDPRINIRRTRTITAGGATATAFDTSTDTNNLGEPVASIKRNTIRLLEWDLWYFLASRMSVGMHIMWYHAKNLPAGTESSPGAQFNLEKAKRGFERPGKEGDWVDVLLNYRYQF